MGNIQKIQTCHKKTNSNGRGSLFECCNTKSKKIDDEFLSFLFLDEFDFGVYLVLKNIAIKKRGKKSGVIESTFFKQKKLVIKYSYKNQNLSIFNTKVEIMRMPFNYKSEYSYFDFLKSILLQSIEEDDSEIELFRESARTHFIFNNNQIYMKSTLNKVFREIFIGGLMQNLNCANSTSNIVQYLVNYLSDKGNIHDKTYDRAFELWLSRNDLKNIFSKSDTNFPSELNSWYEVHGLDETIIGKLIQKVNANKILLGNKTNQNQTASINLIMFQDNSFGLGKYAEDIKHILNKMGKKINVTYVLQDESNNLRLINRKNIDDNSLTLFFVNGDYAQVLFETYPSLLEISRKVIVTHTEELAQRKETLNGLAYFDEIWTSSKFCKEIFLFHFPSKCVRVIYPCYKDISREVVKIQNDKKYLFFNFDFNSDFNRKNPLGLIDVYNKVQKACPSINLIIKSKNSLTNQDNSLALQKHIQKNSQIFYYDDNWSRRKLLTFIKFSTAYVSLHRAEGFGMNLFDSMSLGVCTIATGYSGNLDFMNTQNSILVDHKIVKSQNSSLTSNESFTSFWAEPDYSYAAEVIKEILFNDKKRKQIASEGKKSLIRDFPESNIMNRYEMLLSAED